MSEEIRKLLSGYATNTLTEAERNVLFKAALEDQELFDALQQEQPLKDLFDDPIARAQVRQALEEQAPARSWWSRGWAWGSLTAAVACAIVMVIAIRSNAPSTTPQVASIKVAEPTARESARPEMRAAEEKPKTAPADTPPPPASFARSAAPQIQNERRDVDEKRAKKEREEDKDVSADALKANAPAAPPPPAPATQNQVGAATGSIQQGQLRQMQNLSNTAPSQEAANAQLPQQAMALRDQQFVAGARTASSTLLKQTAEIRYSLLKRDATGGYSVTVPGALKAGDAVRIIVGSAESGLLSLSRFDAVSGNWKVIFPATGQAFAVVQNTSYTIPDDPIEIQKDERLRISIVPTSGAAAKSMDIAIPAGVR